MSDGDNFALVYGKPSLTQRVRAWWRRLAVRP